MAEHSVVLPLSMREVVDAICYKVREKLYKDCNFNPDLACDWFKASISLRIEHSDMGRKVETVVSVPETEAGKAPEEGSDIYLLEKEIDVQPAAPNQVRMETEQALPVATTDKNGKTDIKRVTYKRPGTFLNEK